MAARAAQVEIFHRRAELRQFGEGAKIFQLPLDHSTHEDAPTLHVVQFSLDVQRREGEFPQDVIVRQVRGVLPPFGNAGLHVLLFHFIPLFGASILKMIGGGLPDQSRMLSFRRLVGVEQGRDGAVQPEDVPGACRCEFPTTGLDSHPAFPGRCSA